jgi:hypothetical protein
LRSNLTPDRDRDAFISPINLTPSKAYPLPPGTSSSHSSRKRSESASSDFFHASSRGGEGDEDEQGIEYIEDLMRRLRDVMRREGGKGKGKEVDRRGLDEGWEVMWRLGETLKRSSGLKKMISAGGMVDELLQWFVARRFDRRS